MKSDNPLNSAFNACLDDLNIHYEKLTAFGVEIHKVQLSQIKNRSKLDHLYRELNIFLPPKIAGARFIRQFEFLAGRLAAKYALQSLNLQEFVVHQGQQGEPLWPGGVIGGISHVRSEKKCHAIAYAKNHTFKEKIFGIDIESQKHDAFFNQKDEFYDVFLNGTEQQEMKRLRKSQAYLDVTIFSAKESVLKALYLKYKQVIDFKSIKFKALAGDFLYFHVMQQPLMQRNLEVKVHFFYTDEEIITISSLENQICY